MIRNIKKTIQFYLKIDGQPLPRQRATEHNGELTLDNLRQSDHGVYECVVSNDVATIVARTALRYLIFNNDLVTVSKDLLIWVV